MFWVGDDSNGNMTYPFIIKNGQVAINTALIQRAEINFAMISGSLQSKNYSPGRSGFKLDPNTGVVEAMQFRSYSAESGRRAEITQDGLRVYDDQGRLIMRAGVW